MPMGMLITSPYLTLMISATIYYVHACNYAMGKHQTLIMSPFFNKRHTVSQSLDALYC